MKRIGYMNEFAYSKRMISPCLRGRPPLTKQSLKATRLKILGLTSMAEANQPQYTWISDGAQSDMHVFTICTMYCGMPEKPTWPWNMLTSLFVHTWSAITPPTHPHYYSCSTCCASSLLSMIFYPLLTSHSYCTFLIRLSWLYKTPKKFCVDGWMDDGCPVRRWGDQKTKKEKKKKKSPRVFFFCGEQ